MTQPNLISSEITGPPVTVIIADRECVLSYPLHALFLYKKLTGDSLFSFANWSKLEFEGNYECWIACLWAGLHVQDASGSWKAPYTLPELEQLVGFNNAMEIQTKMVAALTAWMPKEKKSQQDQAASQDDVAVDQVAIETPAISDSTGSA